MRIAKYKTTPTVPSSPSSQPRPWLCTPPVPTSQAKRRDRRMSNLSSPGTAWFLDSHLAYSYRSHRLASHARRQRDPSSLRITPSASYISCSSWCSEFTCLSVGGRLLLRLLGEASEERLGGRPTGLGRRGKAARHPKLACTGHSEPASNVARVKQAMQLISLVGGFKLLVGRRKQQCVLL